MDLLTDLNKKHGTTIVMVLHDINLSARYADYVFAMKQGQLLAEGVPQEVITDALIRDIFGMDCVVIDDPVSHTPLVVPVGRYHSTVNLI